MNKFVSFSRHLEKSWLEQAIALVALGADHKQLNKSLELLLADTVPNAEYRRKARNLLVSIWGPRKELGFTEFDETALRLYRKNEESSLSLQWGMMVTRKPFFASMARFIGRYSKLNGSFHYAQVNHRMCALYGQTESTSRATRAVLKTMQELGVLGKDISGAFFTVKPIKITKPDEINWLLKGLLLTDGQSSISLEEALQSPVWFPFQLVLDVSKVSTHWFDLHQQGNNLYLFLKQEAV